MEITELIEALSDPAAYSHPVGKVEVHQTHISVVFLAGSFAYKIKKPLQLDFLDYGSLDRRRHFCEREIILNRRLAPSVYLKVVPVVGVGNTLRVDGAGEAIEWAVMMGRLPEAATLKERLRRDDFAVEQVVALADRIAGFHARAESGPQISAFGRFDVVSRNARENFEQSAPFIGLTISQAVYDRLQRLTEMALIQLGELIEARAYRGIPRDTHGDLRLGHIYLFPERLPPDDLVIVDCIEFNDRFRHADPVSDMAFLAMDFARHARRDLQRTFAEAYFRANGDVEGRALLPFYIAYRAAVRGKVESLMQSEGEIPAVERVVLFEKACACWLLALGELDVPSRRPCLVLVGGLPGSGKSTLSRFLADRAGLTVIRSDVVRKELAGIAEGQPSPADYRDGIYSSDWDERTYAECSRRAEENLFEGERVLVDASFGREADRHRFRKLAERLGVPVVLVVCRAEMSVIRARLESRQHDASDAEWSIYLKASEHWEEPPLATASSTWEVASGKDIGETVEQAIRVLKDLKLAD
ncbi:AAA family ATPase [Tundrisphaera lichenicola]|uniref:bifunctional aminoglycoside phosphotransferase/ATP-binding protein n=1 Tax=Tundrisphaera lichenicola TaxID=2029860 RepID=UPI003EB9D460